MASRGATVAPESSLTNYINKGGGNHKILQSPQDALHLYQDVTGQVALPSSQDSEKHLENLMDIMSHYTNHDQMILEGKQVFIKWCATRGKSGKSYSRTNAGWLLWWLEQLAPVPQSAPSPPKAKIRCPKADELRLDIEQGNGNYMQKTAELSKHMKGCLICQSQS